MTDDVILECADGIAVITLNRPNALNALSTSVMHALDGVLDQLTADRALRSVIVTAQGRAFSAGGDLLEFNNQLQSDPRKLIETLAYNQRVFARLEALTVPVIGAVNGTAVAGGLELLLCCDVLVASEDAKLGDGHAKYGVVPAGGATVRLFRKIPVNRAMQLFSARACSRRASFRSGASSTKSCPRRNFLRAPRTSRCSSRGKARKCLR